MLGFVELIKRDENDNFHVSKQDFVKSARRKWFFEGLVVARKHRGIYPIMENPPVQPFFSLGSPFSFSSTPLSLSLATVLRVSCQDVSLPDVLRGSRDEIWQDRCVPRKLYRHRDRR